MKLEDLGWNKAFAEEFAPFAQQGWVPARLIRDNKITYGALLGDGEEREVVMGGKVYHDAETDADLPAVGDWVALELGETDAETVIRARLPRQTCLSRKMPGRSTEEQVIAANVDIVVVVTDAGSDYNPRRMERYFSVIGRSGAQAVVLVNKADLFPAEQIQTCVAEIQSLHPEAEVLATSAQTGAGLKALKRHLKRGVSLTLVGSSGVGKSSVMNALLGEDYQWTDDVNEVTGKGRHNTTARELIILPAGGVLIDNPGIREVHMWTDETTLRSRFTDIDELATQCRFGDCKHGTDAGCAIRAALAAGELSAARFQGYLKLDEELAALQQSRKKRQMTVDRRTRRDEVAKARKFSAWKNRHHDD